MAAWVRVFWAAAVLVIPGGFAILLAYLFARTIHQRYTKLHDAKPNGRVRFSEIFSDIHFRDVVREARAAF